MQKQSETNAEKSGTNAEEELNKCRKNAEEEEWNNAEEWKKEREEWKKCRRLVSLFNGISTFLGYLMPKQFFEKNSSGTI